MEIGSKVVLPLETSCNIDRVRKKEEHGVMTGLRCILAKSEYLSNLWLWLKIINSQNGWFSY